MEKQKMYWKSVYTGQIHETDSIPQYGGWELARKEDYERQQAELNKPIKLIKL